MDLAPDTRAYIQILDRQTALIRFVKGRKGKKAQRPKAGGKAPRRGASSGSAARPVTFFI